MGSVDFDERGWGVGEGYAHFLLFCLVWIGFDGSVEVENFSVWLDGVRLQAFVLRLIEWLIGF